jgi:hypothetical protein
VVSATDSPAVNSVFLTGSHLNCGVVQTNFKPSFPKIGADGHDTVQYSGDDLHIASLVL